jgi:hypothetical protein
MRSSMPEPVSGSLSRYATSFSALRSLTVPPNGRRLDERPQEPWGDGALHLVDALASNWGVQIEPTEKTVWFELWSTDRDDGEDR